MHIEWAMENANVTIDLLPKKKKKKERGMM